MIFDGHVHQLPDIDPVETQEWLDSLDALVDEHGKAACPLHRHQAARAGPRAAGRLPGHGEHALRQHDPARAGAVVPRRRVHRAPHPPLHALERGGDGDQGQQARRGHRRPPGHVRLVGQPLRGRLQPLLPGQGRRPRRRRRLHPGPRRPGRLRPRLPRGPADRGRPRPLPHGDRPHRPVELPAPAADAGVLGVPHGVDGPRPDQLDLPRPVQPLPRRTAASTTRRPRGCGASSATARPTSPTPSVPSRWPAARGSTTSSSS